MQTIIDNNQRVFLIQRIGLSSRNYFCNLKQIPEVLADLEPHDEYKISEFWNSKFRRIGKKIINEMFEANQINFRIGKPLYKHYTFSFNGRELGAQGIFKKWKHTVYENSVKNAELALYKEFEHITDLKLIK